MPRKELKRIYAIPDAQLIVTAKSMASFMVRDAASFVVYGITSQAIAGFQQAAEDFADFLTDHEARGDQSEVTALKNTKAEAVRVAIRELMARVELQFNSSTAHYRSFHTKTLSLLEDAKLALVAKMVVRTGRSLQTELADKGVTPELLSQLETLVAEFETLLLDQMTETGNRDILQESRVLKGNALYTQLVQFANTGKTIWETSNVAKYNDYVLYGE